MGVVIRLMEELPTHYNLQQVMERERETHISCHVTVSCFSPQTLWDILVHCSEQVELRAGIEDHNVYRCISCGMFSLIGVGRDNMTTLIFTLTPWNRVILAVLKKNKDKPELLGKAMQALSSIAGTSM